VTQAIFGLIGVVVGAASALLGDYLREVRRRHNAFQVAARMLDIDLMRAAPHLRMAADHGHWWLATAPISPPSWPGNQAALASELGYEDWMTLAHAIHGTDGAWRVYHSRQDGAQPVDVGAKSRLLYALRNIREARDVLSAYTGQPPGYQRRLEEPQHAPEFYAET
jgi:hypothetical protein